MTASYLTPLYEITFDSPVWQLRPDEKTSWLAVELRDADSLMNAFHVVHSRSGAAVLANYQAPEGWWAGLDELYDGRMYLHGKGNQRYGRHLGITALDPATGQVVWQQPAFSFYGLSRNLVVARPAGEEALELLGLDPASGQVLENSLDATQIKAGLLAFQQERQQQHLVPAFYPESQVYFRDLATFISRHLQQEALLGIDFLETGRYFVLGYYVAGGETGMRYQVPAFTLAGELLLQQE
ncbi:MAG: DUF4905 domain-containing protein, partial [Adhaeribacter sp.]